MTSAPGCGRAAPSRTAPPRWRPVCSRRSSSPPPAMPRYPASGVRRSPTWRRCVWPTLPCGAASIFPRPASPGTSRSAVAMESISGFPEFAFGALDRLSRVQATDDNAEQDKEPGKIPHELRYGELASLGLLPFTPYYGTADATLLFLIVFSYAYQWSGDKEILDRYRPNAEAALKWMLEYGDRDGDGFQEYKTLSPVGFYNQGWKDSHDGIRHEDGTIAPLPIALCELQGYAFDALLRMSEAYENWGDTARSGELRQRAARLYEDFNERFWWEEEGTYYLGLDGEKRPIRSVASNAGHCLASGIVPSDRANRVVDRLMQPDMWSGWGIRTLSMKNPSYNPYSYHLGSVWPHDNATIAGGFRRAGRHTEAQQIAEGIFAAAERFDHYSLPELWAGVAREPGAYPVPYLGTNVPQAWAAASIFRLVAILCGIHTAGTAKVIYINPDLPDWLPDLTLKNLRAGKGAVELRLRRDEVDVVGNTTGFEIVHGRMPRPPLNEHPLARPVTVRQVLVEEVWLGGEQFVEGERRVTADAHCDHEQPEARHRLVVAVSVAVAVAGRELPDRRGDGLQCTR